jgi:hypothetical protein
MKSFLPRFFTKKGAAGGRRLENLDIRFYNVILSLYNKRNPG